MASSDAFSLDTQDPESFLRELTAFTSKLDIPDKVLQREQQRERQRERRREAQQSKKEDLSPDDDVLQKLLDQADEWHRESEKSKEEALKEKKARQKAKRRERYLRDKSKKLKGAANDIATHCFPVPSDCDEEIPGCDTQQIEQEFENLLAEISEAVDAAEARDDGQELTYLEAARSQWNAVYGELIHYYATGRKYMMFPLGQRLRKFIDDKRLSCSICGATEMALCERVMPIQVLSINGMTQEHLKLSRCESCGASGARLWGSPVEYCQVGLWPLQVESWVFIDFALINFMITLQHHSPVTSLTSLLQTLKFTHKFPSVKSFVLRQDIFNQTMSEWRRQEFHYYSCVVGELFNCPACQETPHAVHLDGNAKLYRYRNKATQNCLERLTHPDPEDPNPFFVPDEKVDVIVELVRPSATKVNVTKTCGETTWKAAATQGKSFAKKTVTGCMLASCRHSFVLGGLDMHRGEIYAYPYALQQQFPQAKFLAMDTMCKYWPWLQRIDPELSFTQKPFLSVMHAKAHNWKCQMTWSGRVTEGAGLSTGETTEQVNSYLSRLGPTTRHMTSWGRRDRIQQGSAFWNIKKIQDQPRQLWRSYDKVIKSLPLLEDRLNALTEDLGMTSMQIFDIRRRVTELVMFYLCDYAGSNNLDPVEQRIEDLACDIQRYSNLVKNTGNSSKKRASYRAKLRAAHGKMATNQDLYIKDHPEYTKTAFKHAMETMIFPWTTDKCGIKLTSDLIVAIELANLVLRTREERLVLVTERNKLLSFWTRKLKDVADGIQKEFVRGVLAQCRLYFGGYCEAVEEDIADEDAYSSSSEEEGDEEE